MQYLIGVDIGTTNIKVLLFEETGKQAGEARAPSPLRQTVSGSVFHGDQIWDISCRLIRQLMEQQEARGNFNIRRRIAGLAVTGMGEAGVPMDQEGAFIQQSLGLTRGQRPIRHGGVRRSERNDFLLLPI